MGTMCGSFLLRRVLFYIDLKSKDESWNPLSPLEKQETVYSVKKRRLKSDVIGGFPAC